MEKKIERRRKNYDSRWRKGYKRNYERIYKKERNESLNRMKWWWNDGCDEKKENWYCNYGCNDEGKKRNRNM